MDLLIKTNNIKKKIIFFVLSFIVAIILLPIFFGFIGTILPMLGYIPNISENFNLNYIEKLISFPGINKSIFLTFHVALFSTIISLIFSQLIIFKIFSTKFYETLKKIIIPLIAFPHVTMAVGISFLFSSSGFFYRLCSIFFENFDRPPNSNLFPDEFGIFLIFGLILKETPFFLLMSVSISSQLPIRKIFNLGKSINNSSLNSWIFFVFPYIYRKLRLSIIIVLIFSASVVDMSYVLTSSTPSTLSIRILELYQSSEIYDFSMACSLALVQLIVIIFLIIFWICLEKLLIRGKFFIRYVIPEKNFYFENFLFVFSSSFQLFSILSITISLMWSLSADWQYPAIFPNTVTLDNFSNFTDTFINSLLNTVVIATIVSVISICLILIWLETSYLSGYKIRFFELSFFTPLIIPELSFLMGISYFFSIFGLNGKFLSLIFVEILYVLPYVFLIVEPAFRNINLRYIYQAKMLGKSNFIIFFKLKLMLIKKSLILALGIGMIVSISLYTPVYFIGNSEISTLSVELVNLTFSGNQRDLGVFTVIQMFLPLLILFVVFLFTNKFVKWRF